MSFITKFLEKSKKFEINSNIDIFLINLLYLFVILFPIFLLTGPFLPDLIIVICTLSFLYFSYKYKLFYYFNDNLFKIIFSFWIYIVAVSFFSENLIFSLKSSFFYLRFIIFSLFIYFLIKNYSHFLKYFFYSLTLCLIIVLVDSYFQFFFGTSISGFDKPNLRLTGPFDDRQIVGSFISRILPLYLFLFYYFNNKMNIKNILLICSLTILVLISGERTAFFLVTLFIFSIYFLLNQKIFNVIKLFIIYTIIATLIVLSNVDLKKRIIDHTLQAIGVKKYLYDDGEKKYFDEKPKKGFYIFSRAHEIHYKTAIRMFKDNPVVGVGANMFRKKCSDKKFFIETSSCTTHPHNFLIQILAETGLVGTIFYLLVFFILLKLIFKQIFETKIKKISLSSNKARLYILNMGFLINSFIFFLPNGNFFNNYLNAIIFIPVGFYIFQNQND